MRDLRIPVDGATLAATYSEAADTAVVALHGAASGTREHSLYRQLHETLPPAGVGVLTFDRRGDGESTGQPSRGDFRRQALDALAVAAAADVPHVGLWGFSQGGWVAPLAATMSTDVAFLILVASTGVTPAAQMVYATEQQLRRAGHGQEVVDRALGIRRALEAWTHDPKGSDGRVLESALAQGRREPWWPLTFLPEDLPGQDGRREWIEEMDFDPAPVFAGVRVPTLAFYGTDDAWTPVQKSVETWRRARGSAVDVVVIEGASHELTMRDGTISSIYETTMIEWIQSVGVARDAARRWA